MRRMVALAAHDYMSQDQLYDVSSPSTRCCTTCFNGGITPPVFQACGV